MLETIWGEGEHLNMLQMSCRAVVAFFITLALIKIAGRRSFGTKSAFDNIIVIMLGAILARGVVGASPFFSTVAAGLTFCIIHRVLAHLSLYNEALSRMMKSKELLLYKDGKINEKNMNEALMSKGDLMEGLRNNGNVKSLDEAKEIYMERNGQISVIKKEN